MGAHNTAVELMDKNGSTRVVPIVNVKLFHSQEDLRQEWDDCPVKAPRVTTMGDNDTDDSDSSDESTPQLSSS